MSLSNEYKRQFGWRSWSSIFDALPPLRGRTVLDLGCGVGDQAAEIVARGARVIGIDMNEELLREAQSRQTYETVQAHKQIKEQVRELTQLWEFLALELEEMKMMNLMSTTQE